MNSATVQLGGALTLVILCDEVAPSVSAPRGAACLHAY